jgi:tetratricopeptide (TPR) repeat protein
LAKWLRYLVYSSSLIPLVIFAQFISPFHFGKVIILRSIVQVMAALWLLLIWRHPEYRPKSHPITWAFLAFTLAFTLTTFTGVAFLQSWWGTLERMGGLFTFWHYFLFYLIAISVLRTREHWQTLLDLIVSVGLVSAVYGLLQKTSLSFILGSGGRSRPFGTIGNAALFAGYQILVAFAAGTLLLMRRYGPFAAVRPGMAERGGKLIGFGLLGTLLLAVIMGEQGLWVIPLGLVSHGIYLVWSGAAGNGKWFFVTATALTAIAAVMTAVRGSLLGIGVAVIVFLLLYASLERSRRGKNLLIGAIAGAVLFFFLAVILRDTALVKNSGYLSRITDFSGSTYTVKTRFWAWSAGWKGLTETPKTMLVGWGPENFNVPFSKYFNPKFFAGPGSETFFDRAHNMFVEVGVTMGLVGELTYLSLFAAILWTLWKFARSPDRDSRVLGIGFIALTVAYAIHNSFIFDTSANFLTFFILIGFIAHVGQRGMDGEREKSSAQHPTAREPKWTAMQSLAAIVLMIVTLVLVWNTNVRPVKANYASTRAIIAGWQGDYPTAIRKYREAIDENVPGRYEFRHRYAQYLLEISSALNLKEVPDFTQNAEAAIRDVGNNVRENPRDYLPLLYIARMHVTLGKEDLTSPHNDIAIGYVQRALDISPTFVRSYYEIAQAYLNKKDFENAFAWFEKAANLNPDVSVTYWYMGVVRLQQGAVDDNVAFVEEGLKHVDQALKLGYAPSEADAVRMADAFTQLRRYTEVAFLYEQLTVAFPKKVQYWTQLIGAYVQLGNAEKVTDSVQRALKVPEVAADTEFVRKTAELLKSIGAQ